MMPKVPLQQQSIDLPAGPEEGLRAREELTKALRRERRSKIKEGNYLKTL